MNKILITTSSFDLNNLPQADQLRAAGFDIVLNPYKRRLTEEEAGILLKDDVVAMIAGVEPLTKEVLSSANSLKVIARCGVGLDSVDLAAAKKQNILVSNTPNAPTLPVAELTLAHMLNLLRGVNAANSRIREGQWKPVMGSLLSGKCVGIIGLGRIGQKVAELVNAFGAEVIGFDQVDISSVPDVEPVALEFLLAQSDIVSLHTPYNPQTHYLIGEEQLEIMKPTAYLFNISRGGLVDEQALYNALLENRLAGAGLDAFEDEPYAGPLCKMENVVLTAHMGSYAKESRMKQEQEAAANLVNAITELNLFK